MGKGKGEDEDENAERGNWSGKLDFFLSCVGYAVGIGNVWRFPTLTFRNGGVSFVIPYTIMLILGGLPLFLFELTLGQFSSQGPITVWRINPMFVGVGWGMIAISTLVCIYYNTIIMYALYYMMVAFVNMDTVLPWTTCDNDWNTDWCKDTPYPKFDNPNETARREDALSIMNSSCANQTVYLEKYMNATKTVITGGFEAVNSTMLLSESYEDCRYKYANPSDEYWRRNVLRIHESDSVFDLGSISWKLFVSLIFSWVIVFFCLMKGIKSSGKVVYFTATFPYMILVVLLIRGLTLPGFEEGIKFYMVPNDESWEKLKDPKIWGDAATQIFYSLGPAFGGLLTMASYNKFKNNCYRDAVLVPIINCGTSIFAGFAIFSLMGYIAHETNQKVTDVTDIGPGLAFVAYPAGIGQLPGAPIWAFLFFFMLITLGLDSQFGMMETIISGVSDVFPGPLRKHKSLFTFFCCVVGFILAIPQVTNGGMYVFSLMDWYSGSYGLLVLCLFELIGVSWIYGIRNFADDFKMMIGYRPNIFWLGTWTVVSPLVLMFILAMMAYGNTPASYGTYVMEDEAQVIGWLLVALPICLIFGGMIGQVIRYHIKGNTSFWESVKRAAHHTPEWGPALDIHRAIDPVRYPPLGDVEFNNFGNPKYAVPNEGFQNDEKILTHKL